MPDLMAPSAMMALLEISFDETTPTRVTGSVAVIATAIHQGRGQQLCQVELRRPGEDKLVARGQVRLQNIEAGG